MKNQLAMTSNEILKADVLDIVFDNRNKNYGAYVLRKYYNNRLGIALGGMLGFVLILVLIILINPSVRNNIAGMINATDSIVVRHWQETPPPPPPPVQPPEPRIRQISSTTNIEIADRTTIATQDQISNAIISGQNVEGGDLTGAEPRVENHAPVALPPPVETTPPTPPAPTKAAEFPGGQQAWMAFLNRHLRTPEELEAGQKRTVMVRFSVGADGTITQFEVVQSGGAAFDNEVIRVLKKMPKWKPAVQNGNNVSVMFTQPVTFMAFEE